MYIGVYIYTRLHGMTLSALGLTDLTVYTSLTVIPPVMIWMIWGGFYRFYHEKNLQKQFKVIETKLQQNQDFFEIAARIIYQGQKSKENRFVLSQTEIFIAELNGMIADILKRCSFISDTEEKNLWMTTEKGNKWGFAKTLIDLQNNRIDFDNRLFFAATKDKILKGNINEFCARYARLLEMLKQHDKDKIFLDIVETGALGRAFAIFAPLSERLQAEQNTQKEVKVEKKESTEEDEIFADSEEKLAPFAEKAEKEEPYFSEEKNEEDVLSELDNITIPDFLNDDVTPSLAAGHKENVNLTENSTENDAIKEVSAVQDMSVTNPIEENSDKNISSADILPSTENASEKKTLSVEEEIGKMFEGVGISEYNSSEEENEKTNASIFPKFSNLFKKKDAEEEEPDFKIQHEIDPLTLALERSFGKLSDENINQNSRVYKAMTSEENNPENADGSDSKFAFSTTNETLLKLQQELAELSKTDEEKSAQKDKGNNADKKDI